MQLSIQQTLKGLPEFRKHGGNSAYAEGWALYAEQLGKEVGFYQDPGSDYGRLRSELFRAVRLVVDTGIHDMGWSRDQVVEYMRKSHAVDEPTIQSETDRYISWPAQACSYKLGQLKIRELRARATKQLGSNFDIRSFHDEVLAGGSLPLDVLDARITRWIASGRRSSELSRPLADNDLTCSSPSSRRRTSRGASSNGRWRALRGRAATSSTSSWTAGARMARSRSSNDGATASRFRAAVTAARRRRSMQASHARAAKSWRI